MNCELLATADATSAGTLYRCVVCGLAYRSTRQPSRIARSCRGTPEQWHAYRLAQAQAGLVEFLGDTPTLRAEVFPRAARCLDCAEYRAAGCRIYCRRRWAGRLAAGECRDFRAATPAG